MYASTHKNNGEKIDPTLEEVKAAAKVVLPYIIAGYICYKFGKRSVKIPIAAIPEQLLRTSAKDVVVIMSNGARYFAELPDVV